MQVILKRGFFAGGNRYRENGKFPVEIPESLRKILPKDAVVVGEEKEKQVEVPKVSPATSGALTFTEPETASGVPNEDTSVDVPDEDAEKEKPYVNPAHDLDPDRAFSEAFDAAQDKAESEVADLRNKLKTEGK